MRRVAKLVTGVALKGSCCCCDDDDDDDDDDDLTQQKPHSGG